jgi:hypothetical protein
LNHAALAHWMPEDPAPVDLTPKHPGFHAPHALRCARWGCCQPIAWMTLDPLYPSFGNCQAHKSPWMGIPVTVYQAFSDYPEDMRAHAARMLALEIARLKKSREAA